MIELDELDKQTAKLNRWSHVFDALSLIYIAAVISIWYLEGKLETITAVLLGLTTGMLVNSLIVRRYRKDTELWRREAFRQLQERRRYTEEMQERLHAFTRDRA